MKILIKTTIMTVVLAALISSPAGAFEIMDLVPVGIGYLSKADDQCGQALAPRMAEEGYLEALYAALAGIVEKYITDEEKGIVMKLAKSYALAKATFQSDKKTEVVEQAKDLSVEKMNEIPQSKDLFDSLDVPAECKEKVTDALGVEYNTDALQWEKELADREE